MALGVFNSAAFTNPPIAAAGGATIEVRRESDSALASIFSDRAGTAAITNPSAFADSNGRFTFYAAGLDGGYSVKVTSGAFNYTLRYQRTGTAGEFDASAFGAAFIASADDAAARTALGSTTVGDAVFIAASQAAARTAIGASSITLAAQQAATSGTSKDFTVPAGVKRVTIMFDSVSFDTASTKWLIRLGDAGGIETSGYGSACEGVTDNTGFHILTSTSFGDQVSGSVTLNLMDAATFSWVSAGVLYGGDSGITVTQSAGGKKLSAELTTVRVTTLAGTAVFDAGFLGLSYE